MWEGRVENGRGIMEGGRELCGRGKRGYSAGYDKRWKGGMREDRRERARGTWKNGS
jgi:hypothetical protein